jgi:UPF0716 protein FxsA
MLVFCRRREDLVIEDVPAMALALICAVILFPILELALMFKIGGAIGVVPLLLLLIGMAIAGGLLLRWQGLAVARRAMDQLARNEPPVQSMIDGIGLSIAGFLLLLPGMISDILGLLLLIPAIRRPLVGRLLGVAATRMDGRSRPGERGGFGPGASREREPGSTPETNRAPGPRPGGAGDGVVIDGEFERLEERTIRPGRGPDQGAKGSNGPAPPQPPRADGSPWRQ